MRKRGFLSAVSLAVVVLLLITMAGTAAVAAAAQPVTIKFLNFSSSGANEQVLDQMRQEFEKQHPDIKVQIETIGYGDYFTQLQTRIAGGKAPDAYELNYENFVTYAKKGVVMDLGSLIRETGFDTSVLNPNALGAFAVSGQQYGLPASFSNVLLIYNKDLFDKAKVSYPTASWTWADVDRAAQKIRALGKDIFGLSQPIQFWEFYKMVAQNGGSILSADKTKFTINSPQNVQTLQVMVDRVRKSNVVPTEAQLAGMGDWDLFKAGRLGMLVTGLWAFPDFKQNVTFNWDVEVEPGNVKKATHFFSNGLVINKNTKCSKEAFEWIKFMSASKEAAMLRVKAGWELPAVTYPDVLQAYMKDTPPANRKAVFDSLDYLVTPPVIEQFSEMADIVGGHLAAAVAGVKTPKQALDDAQKELEQKIKL
ncbi:MAG: sugar ABC transporter substrate-binding protein [Firmicutes bacterium]|jgi:multiple sugar transport system substrate-binding protein|nr:sugar ABC transporter substrate-binding protein [Bacillota bacterium]MDH7496257.1 sugar ABC transporter substrate-binding protein [Bacillota bacterium]